MFAQLEHPSDVNSSTTTGELPSAAVAFPLIVAMLPKMKIRHVAAIPNTVFMAKSLENGLN